MKYLIAGLGNIGSEYAGTRHNMGFRIADRIAADASLAWGTERYGDVARGRIKNQQVVLLKPSTYMNLSGAAVRYWRDKENIPLENILVIADDIALPFGTIRLKGHGSDGGHNGLKDIARALGTDHYARLRFGIGGDFPRGCQVDYVLGHFTPQEMQEMPARVEAAAQCAKAFVLSGLEFAMCNYNNK